MIDMFAIACLIAILGGVIGALVAMLLLPWALLLKIGGSNDDDKPAA